MTLQIICELIVCNKEFAAQIVSGLPIFALNNSLYFGTGWSTQVQDLKIDSKQF